VPRRLAGQLEVSAEKGLCDAYEDKVGGSGQKRVIYRLHANIDYLYKN